VQTYGEIMLVVVPIFLVLALFEKWYGWRKGQDTVRNMDMVSSISSGVTNITKDSLGLTISIFSYGWMAAHLAVVTTSNTVLTYAVALIVIDFQVYWMHRLSHRINYLWNSHVIHHSSEEFNLACALRQSISAIFNPFSPLLLPAALLGVPARVIVVVIPFHLFAQFWYHTRHIGRLGVLEHVLVTPSHHRVHHAINPEYLDRNFASLFIFWDKIFGTFQAELDDVPPVYGITRPASTWNPIRICFQHGWLLVKDAWRTASAWNKLRIWFMPTGWRPADVKKRFPVTRIRDVYRFQKYDPEHHRLLPAWSWIQLSVTLLLLFWMFGNAGTIGVPWVYAYGGFILLGVFAFTELMDHRPVALLWEAARNLFGVLVITLRGDWFGMSARAAFAGDVLLGYFIIATVVVAAFTLDIVNGNRQRVQRRAAGAASEDAGRRAHAGQAAVGG
jgi:sterol desaturase/sphingolipid hydroxylase (fatty acid hydroxylase superfamily)